PAGAIIEFGTPNSSGQLSGMTTGPGGVWFVATLDNQVGLIVPGGMVLFPETTIPTSSSGPEAITLGPDGNLWFTEFNADQIGRITPGPMPTITEFGFMTGPIGPRGITTGPDGALWFTEHVANRIGRITVMDSITEFPITTTPNSGPSHITVGSDG